MQQASAGLCIAGASIAAAERRRKIPPLAKAPIRRHGARSHTLLIISTHEGIRTLGGGGGRLDLLLQREQSGAV